MLDHVSIQVDDLAAASAFYDVVLGSLGYRRVMDHGQAIGYGDLFPAFWIGAATDAIANRQSHLAFQASSREAVDGFLAAAVGIGAEVLHEARVWPEYHPGYYGAFVRDPDGNNVEAVHHTFGGA
ncbi:MAG: Glyoxalase/bleomycin resistance protein/dioxygenase [Acidimicrobiales bacterium]|nr:Glyoxalase/bleomycin resistance protein/dioxygenase [Acidimicrobiales bacterium]